MEAIKEEKGMSMKRNIIQNVFACVVALFTLLGCNLDLQTDYEYEASVADPHVYVTAWEYLEQNSDEFSVLMSAIEYTGLKDYYTQTEVKYTFLCLNNTGMQAYLEGVFPGETDITNCDVETVRNMLLYHIVDGEYSSYGQLSVEPMFVLTMLSGEQGLMTMSVWKNPWQAAVGKILINGSNGNSPQRKVKTSNIMPTNGVIHILENYCYYKK